MAKLFYWPLAGDNLISQYFGENKACIDNATNSKVISCDGLNPPQGYRSVYSQMKGHSGLDIAAVRWTPVHAAREGIVHALDRNTWSGLDVTLFHDFGTDGCWHSLYEHLMSIEVEPGQKVYTGQLIGYSGDTGYAAGPHLHFQIRRVTRQNNQILDYGNGFFGCVDPLPLMFDIQAIKVSYLRLAIEKLRQALQNYIDRLGMIPTSS
jgi:murein DD-endopeptidase MepM/ murein hydrolase activator NlpD